MSCFRAGEEAGGGRVPRDPGRAELRAQADRRPERTDRSATV